MTRLLLFVLIISCGEGVIQAQHSVAREWNEAILDAIRNDLARPTVHARNLWHTSIVMYDIWSVVTQSGEPYLLGDTIGNYNSSFTGLSLELTDVEQLEYIDEAISYALTYTIFDRFWAAPGLGNISERVENLMASKGYDIELVREGFPQDSSAAAFGYYVAQELKEFGLGDGSNEQRAYRNEFYQPSNTAMLVSRYGNADLIDPNRWQPLAFDRFVDQSGNEILGSVPNFLSPEWGEVTPFALTEEALTIYEDSLQNKYYVYHDPGPPPYLSETSDDQGSEDYKYGFALVSLWSSMLDPSDEVEWDISPGAIGNLGDLPSEFQEYKSLFNLEVGGDDSRGRSVNPVTGLSYTPQMVPRADYARVLAEFWADGPDSETPPGHWYSILHDVMDHPQFNRSWTGQGALLDELEYDVKAYFTLGGAMHDAAVSTWGIKGWYDYIRPISAIRYMGSKGQSSDLDLLSYDPHGLPIITDYIELVSQDDPLAGEDGINVGKVKIKAWKGPDFIEDPELDVAGVDWILAEAWWPYQRPTFVSPPFAGYTSGHSCFSRAAAEVLTMMTGDEYFPGGMGVFPVQKDEFLVFEKGPSVDLELQWATYRDASDQTSLSRIWGGIHPPQDDIPGRIIGIQIGVDAFNKATSYFDNVRTSTYDEVLVRDKYAVYPNPISSRDRLKITSTAKSVTQSVRVELYDILARKVRAETVRLGVTSLDLRGLMPGKYVLHIIDDGSRQLAEVIISY